MHKARESIVFKNALHQQNFFKKPSCEGNSFCTQVGTFFFG